jgi:hypothetical protein
MLNRAQLDALHAATHPKKKWQPLRWRCKHCEQSVPTEIDVYDDGRVEIRHVPRGEFVPIPCPRLNQFVSDDWVFRYQKEKRPNTPEAQGYVRTKIGGLHVETSD